MPYPRKPDCGFGEGISEYVAERFNVPGRDGGDGIVILGLTRMDLPRIAKGFELEVTVEGGAICWRCPICGDLGDTLECVPERHADYYHAFELEHRERKRGRRG